MIIARSKGLGQATWKTVIEPYKGKPLVETLKELPVTDPVGQFGTLGVGLEILRDKSLHYVLVGYTWGGG